ncbi:hypothetical protein B0H14DRAFT_2618249 [Mycena olivaceomarginata]|nr:hypothetical protein B0H14DRAFT_2618249 [Mycena olivaceomarginata]
MSSPPPQLSIHSTALHPWVTGSNHRITRSPGERLPLLLMALSSTLSSGLVLTALGLGLTNEKISTKARPLHRALRQRHSLKSTSVDAEWLFSFSARTIMKLRNQLSEKSAHSAMMVGQWASDLDLIAVDEFESQLVEGWTCKKKQRAPASAEAQGSSTVIVVEDNSS